MSFLSRMKGQIYMINNSNHANFPYQEQTHLKKTLKDLNLMDAFLFDVSTEKTENAEIIARTIIKRVIGHELKEITVESQKQFLGFDFKKRGIRMDLWVREKLVIKILLSVCMILNQISIKIIFRNEAVFIRQRLM